MKKCKFGLYVVLLLSLLGAMLISIIEWRAYDLTFYDKTYEELHTYEYIGMSKEDLMRTTEVLLSYMQRERADMVVEANVLGKQREVFNEREKLHMLDVNALILKADYFKYGTFLILAVFGGYLVWKRRSEEIFELSKAGLWALGIFACILIALVGFILVDFDAFWSAFHKVFFTNDLWLLNPYTDIMIQMFPLEFFNKIVLQIVMGYVVFLGVFAGVCVRGVRRKVKISA